MKRHFWGGKGELRHSQDGFTLIEIAIVVVIIGLLLGGILKGQEMIRNARSHNVANQGNAIKASILGFQDRFRALPGDYNKASFNIVGLGTTILACADTVPAGMTVLAPGDGDGNSRIGNEPGTTKGVGQDYCNRDREMGYVWKHLSAAGFLSGNFDGLNGGIQEATFNCAGNTCVTNAFNSGLLVSYNHQQYSNPATPSATPDSDGKSNQLTTGRFIPVEIISELDRKIDDGDPSTGSFRVADFFLDAASGAKGLAADKLCATASGTKGTETNAPVPPIDHWNLPSQNTDCGGIYLF